MGEIFADYAAGTLHPDLRVSSVSQEHGVVSGPLPVGARVRILPNHACATSAQHRGYHVVRGTSDKVEAECQDGVLTISLPKSESARIRKIKVKP